MGGSHLVSLVGLQRKEGGRNLHLGSLPMVQLQTVQRIFLSGSDQKQPLPGSNQKQALPGSDQKLGSCLLSGPDTALVSNLKSWTEDMGNLCNIQAGGARVVNPPHSLEELLVVMAVKDEINVGALEQAITSSPWADKFRAYLRRLKLEDDENILKFLILVQPLKLSAKTNNNEPKILGHSKLERVVSLEDQKRLFLEAVETFLSEESEALLPLSGSLAAAAGCCCQASNKNRRECGEGGCGKAVGGEARPEGVGRRDRALLHKIPQTDAAPLNHCLFAQYSVIQVD